LILAEQFKSTLKLNVKVVDKKAGQQIVRFEFIALMSKPIKKIPEIVSLLITENELSPINTPEVIRYLHVLLGSLYSENLQVQQNDQGFLLSFDLPITVVTSQNEGQINIDLKQANILVVSGNPTINEIIKHNLKATTAVVEILSQVNYFTKQVTVKHLNHQKLDLVVLADDHLKSDYDLISQHIASLPKGLQPKLMVMQSPFAARLHFNGLYSQANSPLCRLNFQQTLQNLLSSDKANNCLITAKELQKYRCLPVQVEVLFAVSSPEKHQVLIRVLQWLGLHIHIVCQAETLTKHWQSGRYLVLFTELSTSPYIELDIGKSIRRGIFALPETTIESSKEALETVAKHWVNISLPTELNIKTLVADLAPWLKSKAAMLAPENIAFSQDNIKNNHVKVNEAENPHIADFNKSLVKNKNQQKIDITDGPLNDIAQVFDLVKYAQNQGSPELAVYMLDVYLQDINIAVEELTQAIEDNDKNVIQTAIHTLLITTKILSADEFYLCCQKLERAIINDDDISLRVSEIEQQQLLLVNFAEAI
jgi:HPt (histidine-containing phosphotransfer) domain-containing protein